MASQKKSASAKKTAQPKKQSPKQSKPQTKAKTQKKGRTAGKAVKPGANQSVRIGLACLFLTVFVAASIFLLTWLRDSVQPPPHAQPLSRLQPQPQPPSLPQVPQSQPQERIVYEEPAHEVAVVKLANYEDVFRLVENQLANGPGSHGWRRMPDRQSVEVRKIFGAYPGPGFLHELEDHIGQTSASARLQTNPDKGLIQLYWQDVLRLELQYQIAEVIKPSRGRIAIVMDDMGASVHKAQQLLDLAVPVTPAVLPGTAHAHDVARLIAAAGREYMLHIPMQPRSYPRTSPGARALLVEQTPAQQRDLMRSFLQEFPEAVGGNNHMGSRYTEDVAGMRTVLEELQQHDRFFIDSRTIGTSVAFKEARQMGVRTGTRNIFLDNEEDVTYIRQQIRKMVSMASGNREIIAICHPYRQTFEALQQEAAWLQRQNLELVPASQIVHRY